MKRNFVQISSLILAVAVLISIIYSNGWASNSEKPTVIRKKIGAPPEKIIIHKEFDMAAFNQKRPALKPKSEITVPLKDTSDELTVPSKTLLSKNTQPVYNPEGKIDPFQPLFEDKPQVKKDTLVPVDDERADKTALEKIDLSQLKLTGIILAASGNKGLVQEASGRGHVIAKGTYIGTRGGKVTGIQKGKVIVEEKMRVVYGKILIAKTELKLNKK
jgi:type IV pilus assembly protein PilP